VSDEAYQEAFDQWMGMSSEDSYRECLRVSDLLGAMPMFATEVDWFLQGWQSRRRIMREMLAYVHEKQSPYAGQIGDGGAW
jgi:hypothetical protein